MKWLVNNPDGFATSLREFAGSNLTLTNSSAVDVYYDVMAVAAQLNATAAGVIPNGTKIAANGGFVQFNEAPRDIWVRAISQTVLDVQANAPEAKEQPIKIPAGDGRGSNNVTPNKKKFQIGAPLR